MNKYEIKLSELNTDLNQLKSRKTCATMKKEPYISKDLKNQNLQITLRMKFPIILITLHTSGR